MESDPYLLILVSVGITILSFNLRESRKQCNLLTKIKTALIMKFPDLEHVLK